MLTLPRAVCGTTARRISLIKKVANGSASRSRHGPCWRSQCQSRSRDRSFAMKASAHYQPMHKRRIHSTAALRSTRLSGCVLSTSPFTTTIDQLIESINSTSAAPTASDPDGTPLLTLLVTPSFASAAGLADLPTRVLARLGHSLQHDLTSLDTLVAVVDRLPATPSDPDGQEGLAYSFSITPHGSFSPSSTSIQSSAQKPGSIRFDLGSSSSNLCFQLPLAHTVFATGLPSTLIYSRYAKTAGSDTFSRVSEKYLETQTVPFGSSDALISDAYTAPLVPLTPARPVVSSMGNIVRKVLSCSWQAASQNPFVLEAGHPTLPASQELESAVSNYFETMGMRPMAVQVWALIIPRLPETDEVVSNDSTSSLLSLNAEAIAKAWLDSKPGAQNHAVYDSDTSAAIYYLVKKGARLCKVLSGGGGWGKKAGLVSIDPDLEYSTRELRGDSGWDFSFDGDDSAATVAKNQRAALGEMINEGDSIMFLLAPLLEETPSEQVSHLVEKKEHGAEESLLLGPIPSRIDELPSDHSASIDHASESIRHYPGVFGFLSEGGMAFSATSLGSSTETRSKLDVPFGAISISLKPR